MTESEQQADATFMALFRTLRENVIEVANDFAERVTEGIIAEDDGRFGPPIYGAALVDFFSEGSRVIEDVAGRVLKDEDDDV